MTYFNVSRNNQPIFLVDLNFLGLGKLSTTMKRLSKSSNLRKKVA